MVLDEHGFGHHGTGAAGTGESGDCHQQMQNKDDQIAHHTIVQRSRHGQRMLTILEFDMHTALAVICGLGTLCHVPATWICPKRRRGRGVNVADSDLARAAKRLIVTCERLVRTDEIRRDPTATAIPFYCVDAVCEVPYGSYPGNMAYEYFSDEEHLRRWLSVEEDPKEFKQFVGEMIHGVKDFGEYLTKCGGLTRLQMLRRKEWLL